MDTSFPSLVYQPHPQLQVLPASHSAPLSAVPQDMPWDGNDSPPSSTSSSSSHSYAYPFTPRTAPDSHSVSISRPTFPQSQSTSSYNTSTRDIHIDSRQLDSSIGPHRYPTRRRVARQEQTEGSVKDAEQTYGRLQPAFVSPPTSRPPSPPNIGQVYARMYVNSGPPGAAQDPSCSYPGTSQYVSGSTSSGGPAYYPTHYSYFSAPSRSIPGTGTSISAPQIRSASPALSVGSALTSISAASAPAGSQDPNMSHKPVPVCYPPREKHRKQRLYNVDRKAICEYAQRHPERKQEDIAKEFCVERSTVSKILKYKAKWLNVPSNETVFVARHRPSKFPVLEGKMVEWMMECMANKQPLTDAMIRNKAKEIAEEDNYPEGKFKASSGWVENFKHRHGIRKGIWYGDGTKKEKERATGCGFIPDNFMGDAEANSKLPADFPHGYLERHGLSIPSPTHPADDSDQSRHDTSSQTSSNYSQPDSISGSAGHNLTSNLESCPTSHPDPADMAAQVGNDQDTMIQDHHHQIPFDVAVANGGRNGLVQDLPSITEAENAIDIVLAFVTARPDFLKPPERDILQQVKVALFSEAGGVPYT